MNPSSAPFDLLIHGGCVIDGTRRPRFTADVGIRDGRIAAIGDLHGQAACNSIDATGRIVAPGFIDSHTHDDQALLTQPDMVFKVSQGVTTVVTGNCGISIAPLRAGLPLPAPLNLLDPGERARFGTFAAYFDALRDAPPAVNVAALAGHSTLRVMTMPTLDRAATPAEIDAMQALLSEALEAGAIGMSTGTYYPPAAAATTEELIAVGRPLAAADALYVTHMRNEADDVMQSLDETFLIGRALGVHVVVSHHKLMREQNFGRSATTLPHIAAAMRCQCVSLDCYPYSASSTMLHVDEARLVGRIRVASAKHYPQHEGRDLDDIAAEWGLSRVETAKKLQPASAIYFSMDEQDVRDILAFDTTMIGSDGIPTGDKPHPRLWGTFPRVLGRYSRDLGLFPLETAVWKMTGLTAERFGLHGRGTLAPGQAADVVIFNAQTVIDRANYDNPTTPADGIDAVIDNGRPTGSGGRHLGARAGQVLRRQPQPAHRPG